MENILSGFLDAILGKGEKSSKSNRKYHCPFKDCPTYNTRKMKLEIDILTDSEGQNKYACWVCGSKGRYIRTLLRKVGVTRETLDSLDKIIVRKNWDDKIENFNGSLPEEYVFLPEAKESDILAKHARLYLKNRGITEEDVLKYRIGYCSEGNYGERIIIPSFDAMGSINYFIARSFDSEVKMKYKFPEVSRDIIPFEMMINWNVPLILCEGVFDMIAIKRNCIPLMGKFITKKLMKKLVESNIQKIYVALDDDALKTALSHCETFLSYGKKVFLIQMPKKDPSEMGHYEFTNLVQKASPMTLNKILELKFKFL